MINTKKKKKGFSLLELIVVMIIFAILVGMSAPRIIGKVKNARVSAFKNDIETIQNIAHINYMESLNTTGVEGKVFGTKGEIEESGIDEELKAAILNNNEIKKAYDKDKKGTVDIKDLGLSNIEPEKFNNQIANKLKDNNLEHYLIITKGSLGGTVVYNNAETKILDEHNVRYFGLDIQK